MQRAHHGGGRHGRIFGVRALIAGWNGGEGDFSALSHPAAFANIVRDPEYRKGRPLSAVSETVLPRRSRVLGSRLGVGSNVTTSGMGNKVLLAVL